MKAANSVRTRRSREDNNALGYSLTRRYALRLEILSNQRVNHSRVCKGRRALDVHLLEHLLQEGIGLFSVKLVARRELLSGRLLKPFRQD